MGDTWRCGMNEIAVRNVSVSYGENHVLTNFSTVFPAGRCTAIMGPSGCGKTTLLSVIAGLRVPDAGEVIGMPQQFTMVFQEDRLCEDFTVAANLRLVAARTRTAEIPMVLAAMGLVDLGSKRVTELSGGMKRRVAIARALLGEGDVLLMDEPFKGLDAETKGEVIRAVQKWTEGKTVIFVTHDSGEVPEMKGEVLQL